jgi:hypothetical protein
MEFMNIWLVDLNKMQHLSIMSQQFCGFIHNNFMRDDRVCVKEMFRLALKAHKIVSFE